MRTVDRPINSARLRTISAQDPEIRAGNPTGIAAGVAAGVAPGDVQPGLVTLVAGDAGRRILAMPQIVGKLMGKLLVVIDVHLVRPLQISNGSVSFALMTLAIALLRMALMRPNDS